MECVEEIEVISDRMVSVRRKGMVKQDGSEAGDC